MAPSPQFKVVLLGNGAVGKSSIVLRYTQNVFEPNHITTVQAAFRTKTLNVDGSRVTLAIWDTAGQERFHALGPIYYRDAKGAILVYDITDRDSFVKVQSWVKELRKMLGPSISLVIAGNKVDLERNRAVPIAEAERYAASVGATHYSTSAKLNKGIGEMVVGLTRKMIEAEGSSKGGSSSSSSRRGGGGLIIPEEDGSVSLGGGSGGKKEGGVLLINDDAAAP
eukprot:CAMPEP_0170749386 /NCGR_PEP_ID=MMETSP0437-20130122/10367_1 /TAXON_ID=0 /ORGANISM="Sexangularia sp." /LENGTH=223 /DNA_ID=CAMNT_0011088305 /DNA_START=57 /DNA_END=723 /DNA_ORIENTATION=+